MGGTTELAGNFVPVDERLVSFFVSQKQDYGERNPKTGVQRTESFAGVWGVPHKFLFSLAAAGGKKGKFS